MSVEPVPLDDSSFCSGDLEDTTLTFFVIGDGILATTLAGFRIVLSTRLVFSPLAFLLLTAPLAAVSLVRGGIV